MRLLKSVSAVIIAAMTFAAGSAFAADVQIFKDHGDFQKPRTATFDAVMELVIEEVGDAANLQEEGSSRVVIDIFEQGVGTANALIIVDITELGLGDDSIASIKRRFGLTKQPNKRFKLTHYGYLQQCARGEKRDKWIPGRCS